MPQEKFKVVVIGGGTGTFTVLSGLKHFRDITLTAIVTMTDNGGSTGRLRDEFGLLPVGDVRASLVALAREDEAGRLMRELFLYRFDAENSPLSGHNFGNLLLIALSNMLGSEEKAIEAAGEILNVRGTVLPVTTDNVNLVAEYSNGDILHGEKNIDDPDPNTHDNTSKVVKLWTEPKAEINPHAREAILNADFIIMGPGDLYSSLLSNVVVDGTADYICKSPAKKVFICNLVSKYGQTHGLTQNDYLAEYEKYIGIKPDFVLVNSGTLPAEILEKYAEENSFPITDDLKREGVIRENLLSEEIFVAPSGDKLKRSLLRHDSRKLAQLLHKLIAS